MDPDGAKNLTTERNVTTAVVMTEPHLIILLVVFIPLLLCIVFGNAVVMVTIYRESRLHMPTNFILASLACADFLTGVLTIPLELYTDTKTDSMDCYAITYALAPTYFLSGVSLMHQIVVTSDRLIAVSRPLRYCHLVTKRRVAAVIGSVWLGGAIPAGAFLYVWLDELSAMDDPPNGSCGGGAYYTRPAITIFESSLAVLVIIALFMLTVFNTYIWCVARQQANQINAQFRVMDPDQKQRKLVNLQATRTVLAIVGTFVISWTPFAFYCLFSSDIHDKLDYRDKYAINQACFFFICVNSAINPVIYGWKNKEFRRSLQQLATKTWLTTRRMRICCRTKERNRTISDTERNSVNDTLETSLVL